MSEEKLKKKKLIRIEGFNTTYTQKPQSISFALVSKTPGGRKQATKFLACRDYLNDAIHSRVHKGKCCVYDYVSDPTIDLDKMRLLIGRYFDNKKSREKLKENIFSAKRLLNFYEEAAGWDKSKITTVKHSVIDFNAWLITGPKEWVAYTNLLSVVTLIFRIIGNHGPIKFSNNEDVEKWFYDLSQRYENERKSSQIFQYDSDLSEYLPHCWDKLYMIMKHHKEIFTMPLEKMFKADMHVHGWGGVVQLCKCDTKNKVIDNNMSNVYEKFKQEKYKTIESDGTTYKLHPEFVEEKKVEEKRNRVTFDAKTIW